MKIHAILSLIAPLLILAACATYPQDPAGRATYHVARASELISAGDVHNAGNQIETALMLPTGDAKILDLFAKETKGRALF